MNFSVWLVLAALRPPQPHKWSVKCWLYKVISQPFDELSGMHFSRQLIIIEASHVEKLFFLFYSSIPFIFNTFDAMSKNVFVIISWKWLCRVGIIVHITAILTSLMADLNTFHAIIFPPRSHLSIAAPLKVVVKCFIIVSYHSQLWRALHCLIRS